MSALDRSRLLDFWDTKARRSFRNTRHGKLLPSLPNALKLAVVYNRPITDLYPGLHRQIQEEVQAAKTKTHISSNVAHESALHR